MTPTAIPKSRMSFRGFLRRHPQVVIVAGVIVAVLWVFALLPRVISWVWLPSCAGCHADVATSQAETAHASLDCLSCHGAKASGKQRVFRESVMYNMVFHLSAPQIATLTINDAVCTACHESADREEVSDSNGLFFSHVSCTGLARCIDCHSDSAHDLRGSLVSTYSMNECLRCHLEQNVSQESGCDLCHNGGKRERKLTTASSFGMVHGPEWESTHALGDQSTCAACHDNNKCGQCHGAGVPHDRHIIVKHSSAARDEAQRCSSCHKEQSFCDSCHGIEMPHPESFLKSHSDITKRDGQELCNRCHHPEDCTNCHAAHIHPGGAANPGGTVGANR